MKRKLSMSLLVFLMVFFVSCATITSHNFFGNDGQTAIETCIKNILKIHCEHKFEFITATHNSAEQTKTQDGIAIPISEDTILALSHVVILSEEGIMNMGAYRIPVKRKILSSKYTIGEHELTLVGHIEDIAILKCKEKVFTPIPFKFGDSSKLRVGDMICVIGNSNLVTVNIKMGIVSSKDLSGLKIPPLYKYEDIILISNSINGGDSGGLALIKKGFDYEIIGIVAAKYGQGCGVIMSSNYVKKVIKQIETK